jgi:hypothetical protein
MSDLSAYNIGNDPNPLLILYEEYESGLSPDEILGYACEWPPSEVSYLDKLQMLSNPREQDGILLPGWWPSSPADFVAAMNEDLSIHRKDIKTIVELQMVTLEILLDYWSEHLADP